MSDSDVPIRASLLRGAVELADRLGTSGRDLFTRHGIDPAMVDGRDAFIGFRALEEVLEDAARATSAPDFGLQLARQQDLHVLGPVAIAMANSPTVGEGLRCATRFLFFFSPAISQALIDDPLGNAGVVGVRFHSSTAHAPQTIDYGLGLVHRVVTMLHGGRPYGLRTVQLPHPRIAAYQTYRDFFGGEVEFNCAEAVLRVPRQLMDVPVENADADLHLLAIAFLEQRFSRGDVPISALIAAIMDTMDEPRPELRTVARALDLHPRSIQRLLAGEGVTFTALLDARARRRAEHLITTTALPFSQVALRVGMNEQSSLTRAVYRWFGISPSALRRGDRAGQQVAASGSAVP